MGNACSSCCSPNRRDGGPAGQAARLRKPIDKPLTEPSPVFPADSSSYPLSLAAGHTPHYRPDSSPHGHAPGAGVASSSLAGVSPAPSLHLAPPLGSGAGSGVAGASSDTSPIGAGRMEANATSSARRSFVCRLPPLGRSGSSEFNGSGSGAGAGSGAGGKHVSETKILNLFNKYRDTGSNDDAILTEGIEALCLDLELKPEEFKVLLLAWKCNVEQMCRFSRHEFLLGCRSLKADTLRGLQARLCDAQHEVSADPGQFKDLYRFTFRFGLEPGQKVLPAEMAASLWQLVFCQREPPLLRRWLGFLQLNKHSIRGVPRDTWNMFLNLCDAVGDDLSLYDDAEAWPTLFDDFVEYENDRANQNVVDWKGGKGEGEE